MVATINDDEIFAGIHKYKLFRKEGNLFIDVYESLIGEPAHKFVAVPNLLLQESDKEYFGFGDTKADAIKDCLKKVKDIPIETIVPSDHDLTSDTTLDPEQEAESSSSFWKSRRIFSKGKTKSWFRLTHCGYSYQPLDYHKHMLSDLSNTPNPSTGLHPPLTILIFNWKRYILLNDPAVDSELSAEGIHCNIDKLIPFCSIRFKEMRIWVSEPA